MDSIRIGQDWLDNLSRYVTDLEDDGYEAAEENVRFFHEQVVEKARNTPGWEHLADEIKVWSDDGKLQVGINNQQYISEAWLLEYGDENSAPNSLFRTLQSQVNQTNENASAAAIARYGAGRVS